NFEDYQLSGLISFAEKAKVSTSSGQEKKNTEASNDTTEINFRKITVTQTSWNTWSLGLIGNSAFLNFETDSKGYVQLKQAQENGSLSLLTPLHWSISSDRAMISILFSVMDEKRGLTLQAIYFEKRLKKPVAAKRVNTRYVYIRG